MPKLEVGLVANNIRRGDGQGHVAVELAHALVRRGHSVRAYSVSCAPDLLELPDFEWSRIRIPGISDVVGVPAFILQSSRAVRSRVHDVLVSVGPSCFARDPTAYYAPFTQAGWISSWVPEMRPSFPRRFNAHFIAWIERRALARSSLLMGMSRRTAEEVRGFVPTDSPVVIVPGGVDADFFRPPTPEERLTSRKELDLPSDAFVVGVVGEFSTGRKGQDLVLRALALNKDNSEWLMIKGDGPEDKMIAFLEELDLSNRVKIESYKGGPVLRTYWALDALIVPSSYEPFSLVALEGAATGLPLILSSRVGAAEFLNGSASVFEANDLQMLREMLDKNRTDAEFASSMGRRAREVAMTMSWSRIMNDAVETLERVFSSRRPAKSYTFDDKSTF